MKPRFWTIVGAILPTLSLATIFYYAVLPSPFSTENADVPRFLCNGFLVLDWLETEFFQNATFPRDRFPIWFGAFFVCGSVFGFGSLVWNVLVRWTTKPVASDEILNSSESSASESLISSAKTETERLTFGEKIFVSLGLGLVLGTTCLFFLGVAGMANRVGLIRAATLFGFVCGVAETVRLVWSSKKTTNEKSLEIQTARNGETFSENRTGLRKRSFANERTNRSRRLFQERRPDRGNQADRENRATRRFLTANRLVLTATVLFFLTAFALLTLSGAVPPIDYDVLEYHAQGAREFFENGRIGFAPHNVYLNMPLGSEMLFLWGINLTGDVFSGVLIGKTVLALLALLTAFGVWLASRRITNRWLRVAARPTTDSDSDPANESIETEAKNRFFATLAGFWAVVFYFSLAENFQTFANGLNDGVLGWAILTIAFAVDCWRKKTTIPDRPTKTAASSDREKSSGRTGEFFWLILIGIFVGFALSVKYTAVVFVAVPTFFVVGVVGIVRKKSIRSIFASLVVLFAVSASVGGGWFVKNAIETSNPVYPLGWSILGSANETLWNAEKNLRWTTAHSSTDFSFAAFGKAFDRFFFQDSLAAPFCLISLFFVVFVAVLRRSRTLFPTQPDFAFWIGLVVYLIFFLIFWFFGTHRLTRFLVPIAPAFAVLFGCGCGLFGFVVSKKISIPFALILLFGLHLTSVWVFLNVSDVLTPYSTIRNDPLRFDAWNRWFNDRPDVFVSPELASETGRKTTDSETKRETAEKNRLALVYEAKAFAYSVPILYNSCWDETILPFSAEEREKIRSETDAKSIDAESVLKRLRDAKIAFILVHYGERKRFLSKGNYGVCNPELDELFFKRLVEAGVLEPFRPSEYFQFDDYSRTAIEVYRVKTETL